MTEKRSSPDDNTEVSESSYSPSKRIKVNNKTVEEKEEVSTVASKDDASSSEQDEETNETTVLGAKDVKCEDEDGSDGEDDNEEEDEDEEQEVQEEEEEEETEYEDDSSSHDSDEYDNDFRVEPRRLKEYFGGRLPTWDRINKAAMEIRLQDEQYDYYYDDDYDFYVPRRASSPIPRPIPRDEIKCKCKENVAIYVTGSNSQFAGEEYAVCARRPSCSYYALVEFAHFRCRCGDTAKICISKKGMVHNNGRRFAVCSCKSGPDCGYWKWTDGQTGQEAFDEYMDAMYK